MNKRPLRQNNFSVAAADQKIILRVQRTGYILIMTLLSAMYVNNVIGLMTFRPFRTTSYDVSNQPSTLKPCESKPYGYYIMLKINDFSPTTILLRNLSGAQATVCWESPPRNCIYWTWPIKISDFNIISHKKQVHTMTFKQKQND